MRRDMEMASRFGMSNGRLAAVAKGKLPRPCPSEKVRVPKGMTVAEAVRVPKGMTVAEAVRVRGEDAVWGEVNGGSEELWFPGKVS